MLHQGPIPAQRRKGFYITAHKERTKKERICKWSHSSSRLESRNQNKKGTKQDNSKTRENPKMTQLHQPNQTKPNQRNVGCIEEREGRMLQQSPVPAQKEEEEEEEQQQVLPAHGLRSNQFVCYSWSDYSCGPNPETEGWHITVHFQHQA